MPKLDNKRVLKEGIYRTSGKTSDDANNGYIIWRKSSRLALTMLQVLINTRQPNDTNWNLGGCLENGGRPNSGTDWVGEALLALRK